MKFKMFSLIVMFLCAVSITGCNSATQKIEYDPLMYVDLRTEGLNGYATGSVFVGSVGNAADASHAKVLENTKYMLALTEYEISPKENLKNGDIVKITPIYDTKLADEKDLKPIIRTKEVVVQNLKEPTQVYDIAKDHRPYYYLFEGRRLDSQSKGDLTFHEVYNDTDGYFEVTPKKETNEYKIGDNITITFTYNRAKADMLGIVFINTTFEQTITEVKSLDQLLEENKNKQ